MNRNRKIIVAAALGIVALAVTTGWSIMAAADWPPVPYQVYSLAGTWYNVSGGNPWVIGAEDPLTGRGSLWQMDLTKDPTQGGQMPTAKDMTPLFGSYVRTGTDTWQMKGVAYMRDDAKPKPNIVCIGVLEGTLTMTAPDKLGFVGTNSIYGPTQDKDNDRLPDPGEKPLAAFPATRTCKPL